MEIVGWILKEICECLKFFNDVGFEYLLMVCLLGILFGGES